MQNSAASEGEMTAEFGVPAAVWLVPACAAVYVGHLSGPLLFDDQDSITNNPTLSPLRFPEVLLPPQETPVAGRPVPNLSFALNRALLGDSPQAYHAVNLGFHLAVTLLAFALVRRVLAHGRVPAWVGERAGPIAFASALLFAVHPIAVELVLYATQRTESLVAIFYLGALSVLARAATRGTTSAGDLALMLVCAVLGGCSKEVFVTAPMVALFFDRAFFAGSFARALRSRAGLYAALVAGLVPIVILQQTHPRPFSVRFGELDYLLAQAKIVPEYLVNAFWPAHPLLDYGPLLPQHFADVGAWVAFSALLVLGCAWLAFARPVPGFLGVCVLAILAPSSSLFSIHTEVGAQRRIYLPLIALIAYALVALFALLGRISARAALASATRRKLQTGLVCAVALPLGLQARAHAATYESQRSAWLVAVAARPQNPRAHFNLGETFRREGNLAAAEVAYRAALDRHEAYPDAHSNLGGVLATRGQLDQGISHMARAVALAGDDPKTRYNYGVALATAGRIPEAAAQLTAAVQLSPENAEARLKLLLALQIMGDKSGARQQASWLRQHAPNDPRVRMLSARVE